jgi:hypothetical protein
LKAKAAPGCAAGWKNDCKRKPTVWAAFFPRSGRKAWHRRQETMRLRTAFGVVELRVWHGQDGADGPWGCPVRERWGLTAHQQLSAALEDKLAYFATVTGSYAVAAQLAAKVGCPVEDSTVQALVQRLGARAEAQTQARLRQPPVEKDPARAPTALGVLMLDGFQARFRGPGWGKPRSQKPHVEWHELKTAVYYRQEQAVRASAEARGQLAEKVVVSWQGEPLELGRRLHYEALRGGLGRARARLVVADGAPWIWNVAADRWAGAYQLLDFYHASQHLWALGGALHAGDAGATRRWVETRLHRLRHGQERKVLREIAGLAVPPGDAGEGVQREQNYFAAQAGRMNYAATAERGWPIGSGPVESACRTRQCRVKRPGQFWTPRGLRHLGALEEARDNGHWEELWTQA